MHDSNAFSSFSLGEVTPMESTSVVEEQGSGKTDFEPPLLPPSAVTSEVLSIVPVNPPQSSELETSPTE